MKKNLVEPRNVTITGITDGMTTVTLEELDGNTLLKGVPITRIMLCVMACSSKSDSDLAKMASALAGCAIGLDAKPVKSNDNNGERK